MLEKGAIFVCSRGWWELSIKGGYVRVWCISIVNW